MSQKEVLFQDWVRRVTTFLEEVAPNIGSGGRSCSVMQSRPELGSDTEVVFLGCNANENWGYSGVDIKRFFSGNPYFYNNGRYQNNDAMLHKPWNVWYKIYRALEWLGCTTPMDIGHFVFMNAIYFGTKDLGQLGRLPNVENAIEKCLLFTEEVINTVFRPKLIVCFSVKDCFDRLDSAFHFNSVVMTHPAHPNPDYYSKCIVKSGTWNRIRIIGIPHPSRAISNDDLGSVGNFLLEHYNEVMHL